jgi:hypothetical protein
MKPTVWSFDLGKASIGEAVRNLDTNEFVHKASLLIPAELRKKMGRAKRPVLELRLIASLLSSRQFGILTTAGFDLIIMENLFNQSVNYGLHY